MKDQDQLHDIDNLVSKLLQGNISKDELKTLHDWTHHEAEHKDYVRKQLQLLVSVATTNSKKVFDTEAAITRFRQHIAQTTTPKKAIFNRIIPLPLWTKLSAAVALILIIVLPWIAYRTGSNRLKKELSQIVMTVPDGSQLNMQLPDGTSLWINSGSKLSYSQGYGITNRDVYLEGEAFFNIRHNTQLPFTVYSQGMVIKDVGTEFGIRNYADDEQASVRLISGIVDIANAIRPGTTKRLHSMEQLTMRKSTGEMKTARMSDMVSENTIMTEISLENKPLKTIARELSRIYGVRIEVVKSASTLRFHGTFNRKTDSLEHILDAMAATGMLHYRKSANSYELY